MDGISIPRLRSAAARLGRQKVGETRVVQAPYRICPLGAHVDHQLGVVTGLALDQVVLLAYVPTHAPTVRRASCELPGLVEFGFGEAADGLRSDWGRYARGAVVALRAAGHDLGRGICGVITAPLPVGGLSSSAAVTIAYLLALEEANELEVPAAENIALEQYVENEFVGLNNGILDQSVILLSRRGQLLVVDCQTEEHFLVEPGPGMAPLEVVLAYSGITEPLTATDYNRRVNECEEAARLLLAYAGLPAPAPAKLRHVPREAYEEYIGELPPRLARRAVHFFEENARVLQGIKAWEAGDAEAFGAAMCASGQSSIDNYECGRPELVTLFESLRDTEGVYGARFSGAGFRGSCVALANPRARELIRATVAERYGSAHPDYAAQHRVLFCGTDDGARQLEQ